MCGQNPLGEADSPSLFPQHPEGPKRVLLVDDEDGIRRVLRLLLWDMGYEVTDASHGEEALSLFKETPFPVVLTDIKMPVMDGIQLLKEVKQVCPRCEVIMLTGHGDLSLAIQSLRAGAVDFITKPVNDDILEMALKRAFSSVAMMHALHQHQVHLERLVDEKSRALLEAETMAAVGEAVSDVAHSIKGITSALTAGVHVMEEGLSTRDFETLEDGWGVIRRNVERAGRLASNLLQAGKPLHLEKKEENMAVVVEEAYRLASFRADALGTDFELNTPELPCSASVDRDALLVALTNLLENALDALENREEKGTLAMALVEEDKEVKITIEDSAAGMASAVRDLAFRKKISTRSWQGAGIGLMVTARIAEAHGASLEMESGSSGTRVQLKFERLS